MPPAVRARPYRGQSVMANYLKELVGLAAESAKEVGAE